MRRRGATTARADPPMKTTARAVGVGGGGGLAAKCLICRARRRRRRRWRHSHASFRETAGRAGSPLAVAGIISGRAITMKVEYHMLDEMGFLPALGAGLEELAMPWRATEEG